VAEYVVAAGLDFFALADHNALGGLDEAKAALPAGGPEFICGVEVSTQPSKGEELHILGYGFDPTDAGLREVCRRISGWKKEQLRAIVRILREEEGLEVFEQDLPLEDEDGYVGRPVLAELLVRNGIVSSLNQAFVRYLRSGADTYVPMPHAPPEVGIEAIHGAGGLAVLAHPGIETVDRWLESLVKLGLDGIETYRPRALGNEQLYVEKAAEHFGIFVTGGSDSHARSKDDLPGVYSVTRQQLAGFFEALSAL
jgi:predicted metal-dependent phosphoesterase TrpH